MRSSRLVTVFCGRSTEPRSSLCSCSDRRITVAGVAEKVLLVRIRPPVFMSIEEINATREQIELLRSALTDLESRCSRDRFQVMRGAYDDEIARLESKVAGN